MERRNVSTGEAASIYPKDPNETRVKDLGAFGLGVLVIENEHMKAWMVGRPDIDFDRWQERIDKRREELGLLAVDSISD